MQSNFVHTLCKLLENFFEKVGKKVCPSKLNWDSQLGRTFSLPSQRNFPISFKPKVAIAKFIWKMQKKSGIMKSGLYTMPLFLLDALLIAISELVEPHCADRQTTLHLKLWPIFRANC